MSSALVMIHRLDATAPNRFEFETDLPGGWTVRVERDGSVTFENRDGTSQIFVGAVWALDAESSRVAAGYAVENGVLVQNVDIGVGTSYPVLVDPDPDAIFTADGHLVTDSWEPRSVPDVGDIARGGT